MSLAFRLCGWMLPALLSAAPAVQVRFDTAEPEAALAILDLEAAGQPVPDATWSRLFASEGYRRLKQREAAMGRAFDDTSFKAFLSSEAQIGRRAALRDTLDRWRRADPSEAAARALAYLPAGSGLRCTVYPLIKPKPNSFVFEPDTPGAAIMLFLNPAVDAAELGNTMAHELHHVGFAQNCPPPAARAEIEALPSPRKAVAQWVGAFGEGLAMLAAAGGPAVHPHATGPVADRERWDRDMGHWAEDLAQVDAFFRDLLAAQDPAQLQSRGMAFFGVQGPWYTVGWKMAALIETELGRPRLIEALEDPRGLLPAYEAAAAKAEARGLKLPHWSPAVLEALQTPAAPTLVAPSPAPH